MLDSLHIKNFRCFEDLTIPSLGRVNLIVGKNNSGKSTLLEAIAVFAQGGRATALFDVLKARDEFFYSEHSPIINLQQIEKVFFDREAIASGKNLYIGDSFNKKYLSFKYIEMDDQRYGLSNGLEISTNNQNLKLNASRFEFDIISNIKPFYIIPTLRINSTTEEEDTLAFFWDKALEKSHDNLIEDRLKIIEPNLEKLFFIQSEQKNTRRAKARIKNIPEPVTLKSMGEGMGRLLQIFLYAHQTSCGFLLIDEFENGLHYSIQEEVWEKLFKLAKELDIQVFATTHSEDTIKAFCKVSLADDEVDGKLISLGRSAYGENKGKIMAIVHGEPNDLQYIIDTGMETR